MKVSVDEMYRIRKVYRLTVDEMGALCDVSGALISMIEKGKRNLTEAVQRRLIEELTLDENKLQKLLAHYDEYEIRGNITCREKNPT
jgi:transcriptional regulator with XRE-family HTH domain